MSRQIVVDILGDAKKFNKTLDATEGKAKGWGSKVGSAMKVGAAAFAVVGAAAIGVGAMVFDAGAKMEAMAAKANTVFGSSIGVVNKWADANAHAMGLTRHEATGLAANFGDLLIPMGFTRDQAAAMSTEVVGLSGALSEWSGGTKTAAEVSDILAKAMLGEREGLKSLGISITEADVQQQLLKNGTEGLTGAALQQAKALATQELIMAKSTDAQAAYEAGTAKGLRTQNEMKAKLGEVKETLINALYPVLLTVGGFLADHLPAAIKTAGDIFGWLSKNVFPTVGFAAGVVIESVKGIIAVMTFVISVVSRVISAFQAMGRAIVSIWRSVTSAIKSAINTIIGVMNSAIRGVNSIKWAGIPNPLGGHFAGFAGFNIRQIPTLHAGGVVPGVPGANVLTMLQAGERVTPAGSAGQNITVHIESFVGSDRDIDRFADRLAQRLRLQGV